MKGIIKKTIIFIKKNIYSNQMWAKECGVIFGDDNFFADKNHWPTEAYLISIGNHCQITKGVKLHTHGGGHLMRIYNPTYDAFGKIKIGDWVYIGSGTHIMPGVTIGNRVLIAAGSIVTKSIPDDVVVGGNPARLICSLDDYYQKNLKYDVCTKGLNYKKKKDILLKLSNESFIVKETIKNDK